MERIIDFKAVSKAEDLVIDVVSTKYSGTAENVRIPEGITAFNSWTFWHNENNNHTMKRIFLPNSMKYINSDAFGRCFNLEEIFIPASVTKISISSFSIDNFWQNPHRPFKQLYVEPGSYAEAFAIRHNIAYSYIHDADVTWVEEPIDTWEIVLTVTSAPDAEGTVVIPEGVECIAACAFQNNTKIEAIAIPKSLIQIESNAFAGCSNLREVSDLENTKITQLPEAIFRDCGSLINIALPQTVTRIGNGAFSGCSNLQTILLPVNLQSIGASAFWLCNSLKELNIPYGCRKIENYALNTLGLRKVRIPATVTEIGVNILPPPNEKLFVYGEIGSAIAQMVKRLGYQFQITDAAGTPSELSQNDLGGKEALFNQLFQKAAANLNEADFCYVRDARMQEYQISAESDFEAALHVLNSYFDLDSIWRTVQKKGNLDALYELHGLRAIAIALAIKLYICPTVCIDIDFETSKWTQAAGRWWVCSPANPEGEWFSNKIAYLQYIGKLGKSSYYKPYRRHGRYLNLRIPVDPYEDMTIAGKNFSFLDLSGFACHQSNLQLVEEYITQNGGTFRQTVVKNTDYVIVCPVKESYIVKKVADQYEKALALKKTGVDIRFLTDVDFYIHFKLFPKLKIDDKLRVAYAYLNNTHAFDAKTAQKIRKFIADNTHKYGDDFLLGIPEIAYDYNNRR